MSGGPRSHGQSVARARLLLGRPPVRGTRVPPRPLALPSGSRSAQRALAWGSSRHRVPKGGVESGSCHFCVSAPTPVDPGLAASFRETRRGTSTDVTFSADLATAEDWVWVWAGKLASHGSSEPPSGVSCPHPRQLGAGMGVAVLQVGVGPACKPPDSAGQDYQNSPSGALSAARTSPERASVDSRGRA